MDEACLALVTEQDQVRMLVPDVVEIVRQLDEVHGDLAGIGTAPLELADDEIARAASAPTPVDDDVWYDTTRGSADERIYRPTEIARHLSKHPGETAPHLGVTVLAQTVVLDIDVPRGSASALRKEVAEVISEQTGDGAFVKCAAAGRARRRTGGRAHRRRARRGGCSAEAPVSSINSVRRRKASSLER
jgi:hypothetical protein